MISEDSSTSSSSVTKLREPRDSQNGIESQKKSENDTAAAVSGDSSGNQNRIESATEHLQDTKSDELKREKKENSSNQAMQLPLSNSNPTSSAHPTSTANAGGSSNVVAPSPGSASSVSSGGGNAKQSSSNPRSKKFSYGSQTAVAAANSTIVTTSSLPPSAVSAPPYIPSTMMDYSMITSPQPHSHPQPMAPYAYVDGSHYSAPTPVYYSYPAPTEFMPRAGLPPPIPPPPPTQIPIQMKATSAAQIVSSAGTVVSSCATSVGRFTPSPHSVSGSSSPSSLCHHNGQAPHQQQQHVVNYHIQPGEVISLQLGDGNVQVIQGPATIRMVSNNSSPPMAMPMEVPAGHMIQQILDQNGTLQHVILGVDPRGHQHHQGATMQQQQQQPVVNAVPFTPVPPPPPPPPHVAAMQQQHSYSPSSLNSATHSSSLVSGIPSSSASSSTSSTSTLHMGSGAPSSKSTSPPTSHPPPPVTGAGSVRPNRLGATTPFASSVGPTNMIHYGPPPGSPMVCTGHAGSSSSWAQTQGCHLAAAAGSHVGQHVRARDPTHERLIKKSRLRQQQHHQVHSQHSTPATSPAKRGNKAGGSPFRGGKSPTPSHQVQQQQPQQPPPLAALLTHPSPVVAAAAAAAVVPQPSSAHVSNLLLTDFLSMSSKHPPFHPQPNYYPHPTSHHQLPVSSATFSSKGMPKVSTTDLGLRSPGSKPNSHSCNAGNGNSSASGTKDSIAMGYRHDDSEESGVGHEEEEEIQQLLVELLSNIRTPRVSEVTARSALLSWGPPDVSGSNGSKFEALEPISPDEFRYEVMLSDKGKDGKYRTIFTGESIECKLTDLRPCTEYHIRIHALYEGFKGGASDTVSFLTESCEPDQPNAPKLIQKSKTSINLRWNAPYDNGSHIQQYILEYDQGKGLENPGNHHHHHNYHYHQQHDSNYVECYRGRAKNFNVTKLQSATCYRFRLSAVNEFGRSKPSEVSVFSTQGSAPSAPQPPGLKDATKDSILLAWAKRVCDDTFILQMEDRMSGHGFLTCYNGPLCQYQTIGLRRNTAYKFRLQAHNEEGKSAWSEEVSYCTLPDVPSAPPKPSPKGRVHPRSFKLRWEPPSDDGGSPVKNYILELDDGAGWRTVFQGSGTECVCEHLVPGRKYAARVACCSDGGVSMYSEVTYVTTEAVCPGPCDSPRVVGKPKSNSVHLKWGWPDFDGGSCITEFEVDMTSPDNSTRSVYKGRDQECVAASLLPGRPYLFQVRALNRAGPGPWSDPLEVVSGAGVPDEPKAPVVTIKSGNIAHITWEAPINNGAIIQEFVLETAMIKRLSKQNDNGEGDEDLDAIEDHLEALDEEDDKSIASSQNEADDFLDEEELGDEHDHSGDNRDIDSPDSDDEAETAPNSRSESRTRSKTLKSRSCRGVLKARDPNVPLSEDDDDDDDVIHEEHHRNRKSKHIRAGRSTQNTDTFSADFVEDIDPNFVPIFSGNALHFDAKNLEPAATYLFRVCAINSVGMSLWSPNVDITMPATAPGPISTIKLRRATSDSITLSWTRPSCNGEPIIYYNIDSGSSIMRTNGPDAVFTIQGLKPDTAYNIRVQAVNTIGIGPFSCVARLCTRPLPPAPPKLECLNSNHNSLKLKWGDTKAIIGTGAGEILHYTLEMENTSRNHFQQVYAGSSVAHKINKLIENTKYRFRICASNEAGQGPFSKVYEFSTAFAHPPQVKNPPRVSSITSNGCLIEWSGVKMSGSNHLGEIHYKVQLTKSRESESKMVYTGADVQWRVNGLEPRTDYTVRVTAVRVLPSENKSFSTSSGSELVGTSSPPCVFTTLSAGSAITSQELHSHADGKGSTVSSNRSSKGWTDSQYATVILVCFTVFAVFVAIIVQLVMSLGNS